MTRRILIVESQPERLNFVACSLKATGFDVITAASGLQALKQAGTGQPDLIILEAALPDIAGAVVCDIMRRLPSTASIPIILVTDPSDYSLRALVPNPRNGADEFLVRPFTPETLVSSISQTLTRRAEAAVADDFTPPSTTARIEACAG
jgi:DNA-binding response OmpR family regulator